MLAQNDLGAGGHCFRRAEGVIVQIEHAVRDWPRVPLVHDKPADSSISCLDVVHVSRRSG
jgi:hypothetical protein